MIDEQLNMLVRSTYRQSDLAYRIGLLREFLEFVFFVQQAERVSAESVAQFARSGHRKDADIGFLQQQPPTFFVSFAKETFNHTLDQLADAAKRLPTLQLTVPVVLTREDVEVIGLWVRKTIREGMLVEFSVDPAIVAGCQIVWQDQLHDFGIDYFFSRYDGALRQALTPLVAGEKRVNAA